MSSRFNYYLFTRFILVLLAFYPCVMFGQGRISKSKEGYFKGALSFVPDSKLANGFQTAYSTFPQLIDPVVEKNYWLYSDDKKSAVRGFIGDAVLLFEWWTLLGDPIEKYAFKWLSSNYFEVMYEENGQMITKSIYRSDLAKYPDLLKKFDNIEPFNVNVKISFSSGNIDDQKYYNFRKKYNILEDLGSAGYKGSYKITSNGVQYLFAPSGKDAPFIVPTMAVGGWPDFLNVEKKNDEMTKRNIELFRLGQDLIIHSFQITDFDFPVGTYVAIAKKFDRYEKKEDTPKQLAEKGELSKESTDGDDFWNHAEIPDTEMEVYRDPTTNKYGLKSKKSLRAIPATFDALKTTDKKGIFLGKNKDGIVAVNNSGKVITTLQGDWYLGEGYVYKYNAVGNDNECLGYSLSYIENRYFENGNFNKVTKTASINTRLYLVVSSNGERDTEEDQARREKNKAECYHNLKSRALSDGYYIK